MLTIALTGWGQLPDALKTVAPQARHVDYARHGLPEALALIGQEGTGCELAVGWSLGGQLLVRAIAQGLLAPKKLVLLAVPFQFVARAEGEMGMKPDTFALFRANCARDQPRCLRKAWELLCVGDEKANDVREHLAWQDAGAANGYDWLGWLDILEEKSCDGLDFSAVPPTLVLHGEGDAVVDARQAAQWHDTLPECGYIPIRGCGHAPHWHDAAAVRGWIESHAHG